jgi:hypothetical protein
VLAAMPPGEGADHSSGAIWGHLPFGSFKLVKNRGESACYSRPAAATNLVENHIHVPFAEPETGRSDCCWAL